MKLHIATIGPRGSEGFCDNAAIDKVYLTLRRISIHDDVRIGCEDRRTEAHSLARVNANQHSAGTLDDDESPALIFASRSRGSVGTIAILDNGASSYRHGAIVSSTLVNDANVEVRSERLFPSDDTVNKVSELLPFEVVALAIRDAPTKWREVKVGTCSISIDIRMAVDFQLNDGRCG